MNNKNKIYTATDFAKYHAGTMPAKEMYALEKAALEDDFLADALEGYAFTKTEEVDLAAIKNTLTSKNDTAKVVSITSKNNWLRYAAAAVIVLGLGTLFYTVNNKAEEKSFANKEVKAKVPVDSFSNIQAENSVVKADSAQVSENINSNQTLSLTPPPQFPIKSTPPSENQLEVTPLALVQNPINRNLDINTTRDNNGFNSNQLNSNVFQNNLDNRTGGPKQIANNRNINTANNRSVQNNNSAISYPAAKPIGDDFAKFKVNDTTYLNAIAKNEDREKDKEVVKIAERKAEEKSQMEEVVVTGYANAKKAKQVTSATTNTSADAIAGKVAGVQVSANTTSAPKGRMDENKFIVNYQPLTEFKNYVQKNIKPIFDTKGNEIKGKVILSFKTNKKGQPYKIKVVQSLASKCDDEAIALLKNAIVKWPANADLQTVEIVF